MSKSITIWLISAMLASYGSYNILAVYVSGNYWFLLWVIACFSGAIGLVLSKSWSQYFVYAVSLFTVGGWLYVVTPIVQNSLHYYGFVETLISFIPGVFLALICVLSSVHVFKLFRNA